MKSQEIVKAQADKAPVVTKVGPMLCEGTITAQDEDGWTIETTDGLRLRHIRPDNMSLKNQN